MAGSSYRQNIFFLVIGLLTLTVTMILVNVWFVTDTQAQRKLNHDLAVAQNVLQEVLASREALLVSSANVLTADFGFKQAVATVDKETIDSVLENHGGRINANLMGLIALDGTNMASVPSVLPIGQPFPEQGLLQQVVEVGGASTFLLLNDKLFQVILLTVDAPTPIAIAMVGFELDVALAADLKSVVGLDTSFQVEQLGLKPLLISTLPNSLIPRLEESLLLNLRWSSIPFMRDIEFASKQFSLADRGSFRLSVILSENIEKLVADFAMLQANISIIAGCTILLALIFAAALSRRLTQPLTSLAEVSRNIALGNYDQPLNIRSGTKELDQLSYAFSSMQANIRNREEKIIEQSQRDNLTGLYSRHYAGTLVEKRLQSAEAIQAIGINILGFRGINDVFGYSNGDVCLKAFAERVDCLGGVAARLTGGELLWIPDQPKAMVELEQVKHQLEAPVESAGVSIKFKVIIAIVNCPKHARSEGELFRRMNIVIDEAKLTQQFVLEYNEQYEQRYLRRLAIVTELKRVLTERKKELSLVYQPKLNLSSGRVEGVEALIRWNSNVLGFVPPDEFISVAEHAGIIEEVTAWVLENAIEDQAHMSQQGFDLRMAINLSTIDIINEKLLPRIIELLDAHQLAPQNLSFEITESDLMSDPQRAISHLQAFRDAGFTMAIDDFGTGYSSLAYLKNLPVDTLKVDKSFVMKLDSQQSDQNIVKTVLELADNFDLSVVAEGVENEQSLKLLSSWGCNWAQGFHICRPIPLADLLDWHRSYHSDQAAG